jgi:signal transduction histidine kinase
MIAAVCARMLPYFLPTRDGALVVSLLGAYIALYLTRGMITRWLGAGYIHLYIVLQIGIATVLLMGLPYRDAPVDFFSILLVTLAIQVMTYLPEKQGAIWVGVLAVMVTVLNIGYTLIHENSLEGIGFSLSYVAAMIMLAVVTSVTIRSEVERDRIRTLLEELQAANTKLEEYSHRVEQLAAMEERSRLARELHDSVSQTIFSLTMTAQAARLQLERDPARVPEQLDRLKTLSKNALAEMRTLIQQNKPPADESASLSELLQKHASERMLLDGITIHSDLRGEDHLPQEVRNGWFRVAQEALNNIIKHAGVSEAWLSLHLDADPPCLCIEDRGVGFDPDSTPTDAGHMGLQGMRERISELGGTLTIESAPGQGTKVRVEGYTPNRVEETHG